MFRLAELVLKAYADTIAESIVIRSYDKDGNSRDYRRDTTDPEKKIISTIIYGGLLAIRSGADKQSVKDACECIGQLQIPEMNGRDTIYDPIDNYPERPIRAERKSDMLYIYYKDETGTYLIEEIMTNRSITVDEALEIAGVDMDQWADAKGWDGYDWNCIELSYKGGLEKMTGRFEGENNYFIHDYKIVNEIADRELWVYKYDEDAEDYERHDTIEMPDFWVDYLYSGETADPATEKAFEDYIRQELSL